MFLRQAFSIVLFILVTGCVSNEKYSTEEYETNLAQVSRETLVKVVWEAKINEVYANSTDEFRETVNLPRLYNSLERVYTSYPQDRIAIAGYETYENNEVAVVYGKSESDLKQLHYRMVFTKQDLPEFKLTKLSISEVEYPRSEQYIAFNSPVYVEYSTDHSANSQSVNPGL